MSKSPTSLREAGVSLWAEAYGPGAGALDACAAGGARVVPPTVDSRRGDIERLASAGLCDPTSAYLELVASDARRAAEALRPRYEETGGEDGLVELPCPTDGAGDAAALVAVAEQALRTARCPNAVIGIPATDVGLAAVEELTFRGVGTAVDAVYCAGRRGEAAEAYLRGLERRLAVGLPLEGVAALAWVCVEPLGERIDRILPQRSSLRGAVALAAAHSIYLEGHRRLSGARWRRLAEQGARRQRTGFCRLGSSARPALLALAGAVVAIPAHALEDPRVVAAIEPTEVDETEVGWVLREAAAAGAGLRGPAAELDRASEQQRAQAQRAVLAALGDQLRRRGSAAGGRRESAEAGR